MVEGALRILQVSSADIQGGAEKVAWNLFTAYRERGHRAWLAVGTKRSKDSDVVGIPNEALRGTWYRFFHERARRWQTVTAGVRTDTTLSRVAGILTEPTRRLDYYRGVEDFHFPGTAHLLTLAGQRPDVLHLHNMHGAFFDLRRLPWLSHQVPVVVTLHDAWLLSGHCAHSLGCEKWKTGCGGCPDLTLYPPIERDATAHNWRRKRRIYARSRLHVASPSRWLMHRVHESMLAPAVVEARIVPNGVDLSVFRPADRQAVRRSLGLEPRAKIVLAVGIDMRRNHWRDFRLLREGVARLGERPEGKDVLVIVLGDNAPVERFGGTEMRFVPFQESDGAVARYYQAADLYAHAARADTFPMSVLEALACGTPVVASAVGGIPEQIEHARTGFLVAARDPEELAARMGHMLADPGMRCTMGRAAATTARLRFGLGRQVDAYLDWYREMASQTGQRGRR